MRLYTDPRGDAYQQVIDLAIRNTECFVLGEKMFAPESSDQYRSVLQALEPYLIKTIVIPSLDDHMDEFVQIRNIYRSHAFYSAGTYYIYRCCADSGILLKQYANRLADWIYPALPEDLCFLKEGGGDYLFSIAHEHMYGMDVTEEEAIALMDSITGLFFELKAHGELDRLLDDAIKHQTDKLVISGHKLSELPDRFRELTELRELEIFEQDLYRLPEGLFELSKLERLRIMTAELERIPASIAKLKNLKELSIICASSDRPTAGWRPKRKEEISLDHIPPEIGELEQLEHLTIQYTAIHELPPELARLRNLRVLNLGMCMIQGKPEFLGGMKQLEYINISKDSLWEANESE
ncbi:leucine-rich repeat domain-containing protein [Paenibacillus sp. strain BS8-2]